MTDIEQIAIPVAAVAGTGISVTWVAKMMINRWIASQEKDSALLRDVDKTQAVILHRLSTIEKDINGLGASVRSKLSKPRSE